MYNAWFIALAVGVRPIVRKQPSAITDAIDAVLSWFWQRTHAQEKLFVNVAPLGAFLGIII